MHRESDEHKVIAESASSNTRTMFVLFPCRARPPRLPSESGDEVKALRPRNDAHGATCSCSCN